MVPAPGRTSLIEYLPAGVARGSPAAANIQWWQRRPPHSWSLKDYHGGPLFEIFAVYVNFPLVGQVRAFRGRFTETSTKLSSRFIHKEHDGQRDIPNPNLLISGYRTYRLAANIPNLSLLCLLFSRMLCMYECR